MKTHYLKILVALICFAGWGVNAQAQIRGEIKIDLPFNFVINGQNLPAGTYTVSRFSDEKHDGLILSSYENHVSVFVRPAEIESAPADTPSASFVLVGRRHFLSRIETAYDVYTIPVPRTASLLAQQNDSHDATQSHRPLSLTREGVRRIRCYITSSQLPFARWRSHPTHLGAVHFSNRVFS